MQNAFYENISINQKTHYFLYVGEIKALYLNEFFRESLCAMHQKDFGYIAVVPDVLEIYPAENVLAINPAAARVSCDSGKRVSCHLRLAGKAVLLRA